MACCNIFEKFDEKDLLIKEYKHWKLLLRYVQWSLGSCVAITKEHHESISELSASELAEFKEVSKDFETITKKVFRAEKFNYLMLMMKDKHTHYHLIPRYSGAREFLGRVWKDTKWPDIPIGNKTYEKISKEELLMIKEEMVNNLR
jgi:diadenosine tetraphosphate (Ap4A) HIT family hydrolase